MRLRKKFLLLAGMVGILLAMVSFVGMYFANNRLNESIDTELHATVKSEGMMMDQWIHEKQSAAEHLANTLTAYNGDMSVIKSKNIMALTSSDPDIGDVTVAMDDGYFVGYKAGEYTGKDPTTRGWYRKAVNKNGPVISDAYVDMGSTKLAVSPSAPYKIDGKVRGVVCVDVYLDVLSDYIERINYHGEGRAIIISDKKEVLATNGPAKPMTDASKIEGFGPRLDECFQNKEGRFEYTGTDGDAIFVYTTLPTTGWLVGISANKDFVYAPAQKLRLIFIVLVIIGLSIACFVCFFFAKNITEAVSQLEEYATELSNGNLRLKPLEAKSKDEIGSLTNAFNKMAANLREVISSMANTSEQIAASSEELTASAHQSADASVRVAEIVSEINNHVDEQTGEVTNAKNEVDKVFSDIKLMGKMTENVAKASNDTTKAAQEGSALMNEAVSNMDAIEKSVQESVNVIRKLEESSKEISRAVEAISSISEQTNLLALNAAIEAARAGEAGRGFSVVAEEVRKLAEESRNSAEDINKRIANVLADIDFAVSSMQKETDEVKLGTEAIRNVGAKFNDIISAVENIQGKMTSMNKSAQQVASGADRIVNAVDNIQVTCNNTSDGMGVVSSNTQQQSASNEEIAAASQSLANLAMDMQNAVNKFKL